MAKKQAIKAAVAELLRKAAVAVFNLVKSKLFKRAEAKYCKTLNDVTEKMVKKSDKLLNNTKGKELTAKKIKNLYALKLLADTMATVGEVLTTAAKHINDEADFSEVIDVDLEDVETEAADEKYEALIASVAVVEDECGPDGCNIG